MGDNELPPDDYILQNTFKRATDFVSYNASVLKEEDLLFLYGRYKQALIGPCKDPMPGFLKFRSRSKWSAWNSLGDMSKAQAMQEYIDKVQILNSDWDTPTKSTDRKEKQKNFGPVSSTIVNTDPVLKEESKTVFDFIKEGNTEKVKSLLSSDSSLKDAVDDQGLSLLHWACDRGHSDIVNLLISSGIDINKQDKDGQAPLHYASSCGHEEVANILIKAGAKVRVFDSDGLSPADVAYSATLKELLTASA